MATAPAGAYIKC